MQPSEAVEVVTVYNAIRHARRYVPEFACGKTIQMAEIRRLAAAVQLEVHTAVEEMDAPAVLFPPWRGHYRLVMAPWVTWPLVRHVMLHEIGHVIAGDIDEPTIFAFDGPLPQCEDAADLFSLFALLDSAELRQGRSFVERRIRELVPLDNYGWQKHRVPRLAWKVVELADLTPR